MPIKRRFTTCHLVYGCALKRDERSIVEINKMDRTQQYCGLLLTNLRSGNRSFGIWFFLASWGFHLPNTIKLFNNWFPTLDLAGKNLKKPLF